MIVCKYGNNFKFRFLIIFHSIFSLISQLGERKKEREESGRKVGIVVSCRWCEVVLVGKREMLGKER